MASKKINAYNILYSVKIGPSTYHVLGHRTRTSKSINTYLVAEKSASRSKSAKAPAKPPVRIQRSHSLKQSNSSEYRTKTTHRCRMTFDTDRITQQGSQKSNQIHHYHRRYTQSKSKNTKQTTDKLIKNKSEALTDSFHRETTREKSTSVTGIQNEEKESVQVPLNHQNHEIIRLFDEQKRSLIHLLEQHIDTMIFPSVDTIKQIVLETLQSQQQISTREPDPTLTQTVQQKSSSNLLDTNTINQLQDIITQTIEKHLASSTKDTNSTLNQLFAEQKQALIEALIQQQTISSIDLIKQALTDALGECNSSSVTTTNITNPRQLNIEIQITADIKQTRIDAAFRQQRDIIVSNRYLRDSVRQWSNVRSLLSLIQKIQECSTNDLENAWLLFCWIARNIRYEFNCSNNSAECVFQNRTGSSHGFVNLYHECCSLLNIQCLQIKGYIKQNDHFKSTSHVWNAIVLDQYTYLIDPTWGAGSGDNMNEFEDFYFLTSPEEFIYTHYSKDYQLLQPNITKQEFLSLPRVKSNYYRLNLNLLSPKQGFNQTNENIFKISLKTPAYVDLTASLQINHMEYPSHLHTLCQRDILQTEIINCYFALPTNGLYDIIIYAKTHDEIKYQETINMRLNVSNLSQAITFPIRSQTFIEYKCILIEPFRRLVQKNESIFIHMKIPDAHVIMIKNGQECIPLDADEYKNGLLKKEIRVQGDIHIRVRWNDKTEKLSTICIFNMI
jgi:transglutaminase/protease-like cytokinesis protein 3